MSSLATAGEPPNGVLGPFYWTNPPAQRATHSYSGSYPGSDDPGLLGPFQWTNPAPNATTRAALDAGSTRSGLMGPFVWRNEPRTDRGVGNPGPSPPAMNQLGQEVDLWGPLHWRNVPAPPPGATAQTHPRQAWQSPYELAQNEQPNSPSDLRPEEVIPIPSSVPEALQAPQPQGEGGSLSEAESLGEEPVDNRLQFLRTDTVLLEPGEMQFDFGLTYQLFENDFTVVDASSNLVEARFRQRELVVPLEIRYGLTQRAQFFIGVPVGWANTEFATVDISDDGNYGGLGDITTGVSFLLFDGQGRGTDTVFTFAATLPSGDDPFSSSIVGQAQPALGNGFWAVSADLLWIQTFDPVVVFYGVGYRRQFESDFFGVTVAPGDEFRAQLGVGFAVNQSITLSTRFNASFLTKTELDGVSVGDSILEPMSIRFAATVANCGRLVEPFAEIGTSEDAAESRFGVIWTY